MEIAFHKCKDTEVKVIQNKNDGLVYVYILTQSPLTPTALRKTNTL